MFHRLFPDPDFQDWLYSINKKPCRFYGLAAFCLIVIFLFHSTATFAQVTEDTTSTTREAPPEPEKRSYNNYINTSYQHSISNDAINRYTLYGTDGSYTFFKRLGTESPGEMLLSEEERYNRYGPEWEMELNAQLIAILSETFKEQNSFLQKLARIAPFLGFGFFEEYREPIVPRISDNDTDVPIREP